MQIKLDILKYKNKANIKELSFSIFRLSSSKNHHQTIKNEEYYMY